MLDEKYSWQLWTCYLFSCALIILIIDIYAKIIIEKNNEVEALKEKQLDVILFTSEKLSILDLHVVTENSILPFIKDFDTLTLIFSV